MTPNLIVQPLSETHTSVYAKVVAPLDGAWSLVLHGTLYYAPYHVNGGEKTRVQKCMVTEAQAKAQQGEEMTTRI